MHASISTADTVLRIAATTHRHAEAVAKRIARRDQWVAACGGTEQPFTTRAGRTLHYMWNRTTGEHAYYDVRADVFLTNDEAHLALGV